MPRLPSRPARAARPNADAVGSGAPAAAGESSTIGITALVRVSRVEPSLAARARITIAASAYVSAAARTAATPRPRAPPKLGAPRSVISTPGEAEQRGQQHRPAH